MGNDPARVDNVSDEDAARTTFSRGSTTGGPSKGKTPLRRTRGNLPERGALQLTGIVAPAASVVR